MASYLEGYGAGEEQRERLIKRTVLWGGGAIIVAVGAFVILRNWSEEQVVKHFFALLKDKEYQQAYALFGCTPDHPCKYYSPAQFTSEWGPSSPYADPSTIHIDHVDSCGNGVVFDVESPKTEGVGLFVDRETHTLSYAQAPRCPGRHLQLWEFFKAHFG
jgi:hypothetical protein